MNGGANDDFFLGGLGADAMDGGSGTDFASYAGSSSAVTVFLDGTAGSGGEAQGDTLVNVEDLLGSGFDDVLIGNDSANTLTGGNGDDEMGGGNGNDTLIGGNGTDVLVGGAGADDLQGGAAFDIAFYLGSSAAVNVNLATGNGFGGEAQGDTFNSLETVIASNFSDILTGSNAANTFVGRDGSDTFFGSAGGDILIGGQSAFVDGTGIDTVNYFGQVNEIAVNLTNNTAQGASIGSDQLFGIENVVGTGLGDLLIGDGDNNFFTGNAGGDLYAGPGWCRHIVRRHRRRCHGRWRWQRQLPVPEPGRLGHHHRF